MANDKKVVFITGASSGIGFQLAKKFADDIILDKKYVIYATSRRITPEMEQIASEQVRVRKLDIKIDNDCQQIINEILEQEKQIDILVHCTGKNHFKPIETVTITEAKSTIITNMTGLINLTGKCLQHMKQTGCGHIIAVSAFSGILGIPFNSIYSASRFALEGYFESLRQELSGSAIRLNIVEVGPVTSSHDVKALRILQNDDKDDVRGCDQELFETFKQQVEASYQTMSQSPEVISSQIRTIIESHDNGQFRHETNQLFANALSHVFKEKINVKPRLSSVHSTL